ncbi:hypothetical protein AAG570_009355 [Ranatra chinensis]|uniref:Uncharacterized protein n=1 Tax=Ranatra chinensis TaxID=642074 RepID=A0ABD0YQY7_9HEMI
MYTKHVCIFKLLYLTLYFPKLFFFSTAQKVCGQHIADGRYIVEIVVALEPLDFVLSPVTLGKFLGVIEPLLGWSGFNQPHQKAPQRPLSGQPSLGFTTASLPLLYLNLQYIRILLPATLLPREKNNHDVIVVNIEGVSLKSEAVNPVTRKILRSDLYASAHDWSEIVPQLDSDETCGQNPAVYWNSGVPPGPAHLRSLLSSLNVCLIVAPPIMTKGFVVSGLNVEVSLSKLTFGSFFLFPIIFCLTN